MRNLIRVTIAGCGFWLLAGILFAQEQSPRALPGNTIEIGQKLADALRVLREHRIEFGEGGFDIFIPSEDHANLICVLDKKNTYSAIFYSKSKKVVTGISLVFFPTNNQTKLNRVWLPAKSIALERDWELCGSLPPADEGRT